MADEPNFESGASAVNVALATGWSDVYGPCFPGKSVTNPPIPDCGRIAVMLPVSLPICCQIVEVGDSR